MATKSKKLIKSRIKKVNYAHRRVAKAKKKVRHSIKTIEKSFRKMLIADKHKKNI